MSQSASHAAITIRAAQPDDAATLSEIALRSKAFWGYDAAFMAACRDDLRISPAEIDRHTVYVALVGAQPVGFYELRTEAERGELTNLFVAPEWIGQGVGQRLWQHAVAQARSQSLRTLDLQSDPHAEPFYQAMGARRIGQRESTVFAGRMLPLMRYDL